MSDLDGVQIKIARAGEHLKALSAQIDQFRRSKPYAVVAELDAQTGEQVIRAQGTPIAPPIMPVVGDVLYNLRSALDHLAWQLVIRAGNKPTTRTEFPIFNDPKAFARSSPSKVKGMRADMVDAIRLEQPCFGWNPNRNRAMWALQEYGNTDKHRMLLAFVSSQSGMFWDPPGPSSYVNNGPVQDGTVLARFPPGYHKGQISLMPAIAFSEPPAAGEDIQLLFGMIEMQVTRIAREFETAFF